MRFLSPLRFILFVVLFSASFVSRGQQLSDKAFVSLLTCGPGEELYSVFGHTAIRVADPVTGTDVVFNYGMFDFDTPFFYLKFIKGDLQYFVSAASYQDFMYTYQYYNRDVFEQRLNLTQEQKQNVVNELITTLNSDKKYYTYKYFHRNCTTMVADVLDKHLAVKISEKNTDSGKSYRKIVCERLRNSFFESLGINLIFGAKTDIDLGKPFLPEQLMQGVAATKVLNGTPLSAETEIVYKSTAPEKTTGLNSIYTFIVVCLVLMVVSKNIVVRRTLYAIMGLMGLFFCLVGLYSFHTEITWNYNALLVNPLFLVVLYFSFTKKDTALRKTAWVVVGCTVVYLLFMLNKPHLPIVLPLIALVLVMLSRDVFPLIKVFSLRRQKVS